MVVILNLVSRSGHKASMIKLLMRAPVRPSLCVAKGVIEKISSNRAMFESAILKETLYLAHSTISVRSASFAS
ncbi:MAG TPA: hypothetical protein DER02_10675, partial [Gammaproteobacteria bacterium]|nr:hypothetical protein [Gammaproteobacteria bacterium]